MGLETLIVSLYGKVVRSTFEIEDSLDEIKSTIESNSDIPTLKGIIYQKNGMSQIMNQISTIMGTLSVAQYSTTGVIQALKASSTVIKTIPIPVSTPPGLGIPTNILTKYSDNLDEIRESLKENEGNLNTIKPVISEIIKSTMEIQSSLREVERIIASKIDENVDSYIDMEVNNKLINDGYKRPYDAKIVDDTINSTYIQDLKLGYKNQILEELNIEPQNEKTDKKFIGVSNNLDESRLNPNTDNPLIYKNYKLTIEDKPNNPYSSKYRRIKGVNLDNGSVIFNDEGEYSFSSTVEVLLNEIKYQIDIIPTLHQYQQIDIIPTSHQVQQIQKFQKF